MRALVDGCGRTIDHLRLSVTAACDLRCLYCRPRGESPGDPCGRPLTDAQRVELVTFLTRTFGLRQLRLTGGEPLLHHGLTDLIAAIRAANPRLEIAMTTNATRLADHAAVLRSAGLDRLNVSLDSLDPCVYANITGGRLHDVLAGLDAAAVAGFPPPRVNCVVLRGLNDDELEPLVRWALERSMEPRFLEAMPIGPAAHENRRRFMPGDDIRARLERAFTLRPLVDSPGQTALRYRARSNDLTGVIGLITPLSRPFCGACRRMRITADGMLFPCLLDDRHADLHPAWTNGALDERRAAEIMRAAVLNKRETGPRRQPFAMVRLGG